MTIGKADLMAKADDGFTSRNLNYFNTRYEIKHDQRPEQASADGHVKYHVALDKNTGKDVLLKEYDAHAWTVAEKESAAMNAIQSPKVMKPLDTVRVRESRVGSPQEVVNKTYLVFERSTPRVEVSSEKDVWNVLAQVTQAVADTHRADRLVGELQPESLFRNERGVLLGDLRASKFVNETGNESSSKGNDVRAIYKLGAGMLKDLGKRTDAGSLSPVARNFIAKADGGGGVSFWNLNRYLKQGVAENGRSDTSFVKAKL